METNNLGALDIEIGSYDEVEAEANKILAPGIYRFAIQKLPVVKHSKEKGNPFLAWELKTIDCADPADNNFTIFYNTPLEGKGRGIFLRFCNACGKVWEGNRLTGAFIETFLGVELMGEVSIREYQGKEQNELKSVQAI